MATRSQARDGAIALLYAIDMGNESADEDYLKAELATKKIINKQQDFALGLIKGTLENKALLDLLIEERLFEWKIARVGALDRAILRMGGYELLFSEIDVAIIINEAINISKVYGDDKSPKFINGVLDNLAKLRGDKEALIRAALAAREAMLPIPKDASSMEETNADAKGREKKRVQDGAKRGVTSTPRDAKRGVKQGANSGKRDGMKSGIKNDARSGMRSGTKDSAKEGVKDKGASKSIATSKSSDTQDSPSALLNPPSQLGPNSKNARLIKRPSKDG